MILVVSDAREAVLMTVHTVLKTLYGMLMASVRVNHTGLARHVKSILALATPNVLPVWALMLVIAMTVSSTHTKTKMKSANVIHSGAERHVLSSQTMKVNVALFVEHAAMVHTPLTA